VSPDLTLYLDDMIEACRRIGQYTDGLGRAQLVSDTMAHDAVLRNLEVLGEAAKNVPPTCAASIALAALDGSTRLAVGMVRPSGHLRKVGTSLTAPARHVV
jgi:hypothetical protein